MSDTSLFHALSAVVGGSDTASDGELLQRFAEADDRTAFELVVRRHAELVWSACRSALSRDLHAAEDAFQATFLILARKAGTVRDASVAGWLFRVARNVAMRARGRAARHDALPLPDALVVVGESAQEAAARREVVPIVAQEIDRLTSKLRDAVVLCFFEGHTHAEAAARLGWPIGTLASRLARAKDVLRDRLTRRGVVLPAGGLAAVFTVRPANAAPALLIRSIAATSVDPAIRVSPAVLSLTNGVLSAMRFAKLKTFVAVSVVALGLTAALAAVPSNATADPAPTRATLVLAPAGIVARPLAQAKEDKVAKELEAKELKALQGKWRVVKCEAAGKEFTAEELVKFRMAIENDVMTSWDGDPKTDQRWKIKLAPGKSPKEIDSMVLSAQFVPKGTTTPGIYKLDGDKLTMCFPIIALPIPIGDRPKELKADNAVTLTVFERVKDEKEELAALAGEWKGAKASVSGKEFSEDELAKGKWVIKGAELVIVAEGDADVMAAIKLDPDAAPPAIDLTVTEGNEKVIVLRGIYFRQGDKLTIAYRFRDPKAKKDNRPTELKPGDDVAFVVFERTPK